ncbi:nucleotide exchange factor GrpE [Candidatus Uhrbacteria bacterium]|nr:nucleotide exchange factor GrpE [Candidatus Uhrbacteria bacterium]
MDEITPNEIDIDALKKESEEYLAGWKRAQADYQNLKKDSERAASEYAKFANERLLSDLLPAIDQFNLALAFIPDTSTLSPDEKKKWDNWLVGIKAVKSLWDHAAQNAGLSRVPVDGTFDPMLHDAAGTESVEGKESGTIVRVVQEGWSLHGKVLRPARVIITE